MEEEQFEMEYVESSDCKTHVATGFVLSSTASGQDFLQLLVYADVSRIRGETVKRIGVQGSSALFEVAAGLDGRPYREIQGRFIASRAALIALADVIRRSVSQIDEAMAATDADKLPKHQ